MPPEGDPARPGFDEATAVERIDGAYRAALSAAYVSAMGPFGGYLATIALRCAVTISSQPRLISVSCHFHSIARPGAVQIDARTIHRTRRAESVLVTLRQDELPVLTALAELVADGAGIDHEPSPVPSAPPPTLVAPLASTHKRFTGFWFLEPRPIYEPSLSQSLPQGEPPWGLAESLARLVDCESGTLRAWIRLRPDATFADPTLDAARTVMAVDWLVPFLASAQHIAGRVVLNSTLNISVALHGRDPLSEWLYCDARIDDARGGIAHGSSSVWSEGGVLLATASVQMLQRVRL